MKALKSNWSSAGILLLICSGMLISCTKKVPYKYVANKDKVESKSMIDTNAEYIYVASSDLSNQDSSGAAQARPFWQGEEKIVKFRFTENSLQAIEVNEEERLQDNKTNDRILMDIPVTHIDYRCSEDRYGKCTNAEEKNDDISWNQKSKFQPDFDKLKTVGTSLLPVEMDKVFGTSCFNETSSQFLGYKLEQDSLNVQILKVFKGDMKCLSAKGINIHNLDDLQSQIIYHYSFTRLDKMASPGYQAVSYPIDVDETAFGFFTTKNRKYDIDFTRTEKMRKQYMNRWNPAAKEIVYYLSDNFNKPQFKSIKKATQESFDKVNNGLKAAGLDMRLVLKDPANKAPGDVRNSMIILVEDPVNGGPLGYGPTVANPRTGEIMSGRVAMYYGNYVGYMSYVYDEVVRELRREKSEANLAGNKDAKGKLSSGLKNPTVPSTISMSKNLAYKTAMAKYIDKTIIDPITKKTATKYLQAKQSHGVAPRNSQLIGAKTAVANLAGLKHGEFEKVTQKTDMKSVGKDVLSAMSKYCNYPAELFPFNEIVKSALQNKLGEDLKPWTELSDNEKQAVIDIILPAAWEPTLVHELGHNLGLRHNFGGSQDKDNFYSKEELNAMGVSHIVPYSSVMDYGYSELTLLPTLGKYDIAALRFAYKRQVESDSGETLTVKTSLSDMEKADSKLKLKKYKYCTDEHVEVNPDCKRFDKGTSYTEIVTYLTQSYDDLYRLRNYRNGRESFSKLGDASYYNATKSRFNYIRAFMERYEDIKNTYHLDDSNDQWKTDPTLKDLKNAAILSGKFFIKVLGTPDKLCAIAKESDPNVIIEVGPIAEYTRGNAVDCFKDATLAKGYKVVAQAGKSFIDMKDPDSENHYADQIDVRGIYVDKILATKNLFDRRIGNSLFDEFEDNYLDLPEVSSDAVGIVNQMLANLVNTDVTFQDENGIDVLTIPFHHDVFLSPAQLKERFPTHWIPAPMDDFNAKTIGIPMQSTSFQQVMLNLIVNGMKTSQMHDIENRAMLDSLQVVRTNKVAPLDKDAPGQYLDMGGLRLVASPENALALQSMQFAGYSAVLGKLSDADLDGLITERAGNDGKPVEASKYDKIYAEIPTSLIQAYKAGTIQDPNMYYYLLSILPGSNVDQTPMAASNAASDED